MQRRHHLAHRPFNRPRYDLLPVPDATGQPIPCTVAGHYADGTAFTTSSSFPLQGRDFYDLSRCTATTLRIDLLNTAAQNLMVTAGSTEVTNHAAYRMAIYETDVNQSNSANDLNLYTLQGLPAI